MHRYYRSVCFGIADQKNCCQIEELVPTSGKFLARNHMAMFPRGLTKPKESLARVDKSTFYRAEGTFSKSRALE